MRRSPFLLALALLVRALPAAADTTLDDFEGATPLAGWTFSNGAEFPGATGALTVGAGHPGSGAHLAFDLSCTPKSASCDPRYVAALRTLPAPTTIRALTLWMKSPPGIRATVRVVDDSGQTLQYPLARPLEATRVDDWYRQGLVVAPTTNHFGGADDGAVHQPIHALAILAADPFDELGRKGELAFDELRTVDAVAMHVGPGAPIAAPLPAGVTDLATGLGVNIHFTDDEPILDALGALGITYVRMDLFWGGIETKPGVYDFTAFDALLGALDKRGLGAHLIFDYGNALHSSGTSPDGTPFSPQTSAEVTAFGDYVAAAVAHFAGRNVEYEVYNEPNIGFWRPTPSASDYAALCKEAVARAHAADPKSKVSTAGVAGFDFAFVRAFLAAGGAAGADAIGVHPYRQSGGETLADELLVLRTLAAALPGAPPVWDTEWGYSSQWLAGGDPLGGRAPAARDRQSILFAREALSAWTSGLPRFVLYDLRDDGSDPTNAEHNFGLFAQDGGDKPAAIALRALAKATRGRTPRGWLETPLPTVRALSLRGAADEVVVVWVAEPGSAVDLTVEPTLDARDHLGAPVSIAGGHLAWKESDGPLYLTFAATDGGDAGADATVGDAGHDAGHDAPGDDARADGSAPIDASADGASDGAVDAGSDASSGCGCRVGRAAEPPNAAALLPLLLLLRRRRRAAR